MEPADDRSGYPWWVRLGLFGSRTRRQVMSYFWMSVLFAPAFIAIGIWLLSESVVFTVGGIMFLVAGVLGIVSAVTYWLVVRWVDQHGQWQERA